MLCKRFVPKNYFRKKLSRTLESPSPLKLWSRDNTGLLPFTYSHVLLFIFTECCFTAFLTCIRHAACGDCCTLVVPFSPLFQNKEPWKLKRHSKINDKILIICLICCCCCCCSISGVAVVPLLTVAVISDSLQNLCDVFFFSMRMFSWWRCSFITLVSF